MKARKTLLWLAILALVLWTIFDTTNRPTQAQSQSGSDSDVIISRLDTVIGNQKAILADLVSMKEELRIIKIRITQQQ